MNAQPKLTISENQAAVRQVNHHDDISFVLTLVTGNLPYYQPIQALGYPLRLDNWRTELRECDRRLLS